MSSPKLSGGKPGAAPKKTQQLRCCCPHPPPGWTTGATKPVPKTTKTGTGASKASKAHPPKPIRRHGPTPAPSPRQPQGAEAGFPSFTGALWDALSFVNGGLDYMYQTVFAAIPAPPASAVTRGGPKPAAAGGQKEDGGPKEGQQTAGTTQTEWASILASGPPSNPGVAADVLAQLYQVVKDNLPNPQLLVALVDLLRTSGGHDPNTLNQVSAALFNNVDLGPALRNMDPASAANAVKSAFQDPNLVGPLASFFGQHGTHITSLMGNQFIMMLLLHVITNVAAPHMKNLVQGLCKSAGTLVQDDVGRVVMDAALMRSTPDQRLALLKALDFADVDEETAAPFKEVLLKGMSEATPNERRDILLKLFPSVFGHPNANAGDQSAQGTTTSGGEPDKKPEDLLNEMVNAEAGSAALVEAVDELFEKLSDAGKDTAEEDQ